ncbi:PQQ-binding-like beta-propeller repeat protein [Dactylosporangium sp. CA-092794]|uniref:outer membrane protein assembly factor BamB family protein n=1 Tax=Dactylosporangium sp. CA-092794 TaxID=3239929 RepID=UPI003D90E2E5
MQPPAVIDLDRPVPASPPRRRGGRRPAAGLLLAGVLVLAAGAQRMPAPDPVVRLSGIGVGDIRVDGRAVYLVRRPDVDRAFVEAYRMPGGTPRWVLPVPVAAHIAAVEGDRVVLAVSEPGRPWASALVGRDAGTGAQVWRRTGHEPSAYGTAGASGVLVTDVYPPGGDPREQLRRPASRMAGVDIRTGELRWSLDTPADTMRDLVFTSAGRFGIAELDPGGTLRIRGAESAEVVRTVRLDLPDRVGGFFIFGDRLLAYRSGLGSFLASAVFDLATGRRLWQRTDEPDGIALWFCGGLLCTGTGLEIAALDPDTGRELWRLDGWTGLSRLDDRHMLATRRYADVKDPWLSTMVVDAATGRTVRRFDGWDVLDVDPARGVLVAGRAPAGPSLIGWLDGATGAVRVIGRAAEHWSTPPLCVAGQVFVACRSGDVRVWALPH